MTLEELRKTTKETVDELSKAARAHAELAKDQYEDYTDKHGDPVRKVQQAVRTPIERTRERAVELTHTVNERTVHLADTVNTRAGEAALQVGERAQRVSKTVNERTDRVIQTVNEHLPFKVRQEIRTEPVGTVDVQPDGGSPTAKAASLDEDVDDASESEGADDGSAAEQTDTSGDEDAEA